MGRKNVFNSMQNSMSLSAGRCRPDIICNVDIWRYRNLLHRSLIQQLERFTEDFLLKKYRFEVKTVDINVFWEISSNSHRTEYFENSTFILISNIQFLELKIPGYNYWFKMILRWIYLNQWSSALIRDFIEQFKLKIILHNKCKISTYADVNQTR